MGSGAKPQPTNDLVHIWAKRSSSGGNSFMDFQGNKFNFLVHLQLKICLNLQNSVVPTPNYGITGPKTSSATALPAHRAPPPLGSGSTPQHIAASSCLQTTAHMAKLYRFFAIPRTPDTREMLLAAAGNPRSCKSASQ